jgi:hypothetical protein
LRWEILVGQWIAPNGRKWLSQAIIGVVELAVALRGAADIDSFEAGLGKADCLKLL